MYLYEMPHHVRSTAFSSRELDRVPSVDRQAWLSLGLQEVGHRDFWMMKRRRWLDILTKVIGRRKMNFRNSSMVVSAFPTGQSPCRKRRDRATAGKPARCHAIQGKDIWSYRTLSSVRRCPRF